MLHILEYNLEVLEWSKLFLLQKFFLDDKVPINGRILDFVHKERKYCVFVFLLHVNIVSDIWTEITFQQKCHTRKGGGYTLSNRNNVLYTKYILHGFNPLLHRRPCLSQLHDMDVSTSWWLTALTDPRVWIISVNHTHSVQHQACINCKAAPWTFKNLLGLKQRTDIEMISIKTNREVAFLPRVCGLVLSFGNICDHLKINQTKMYKNNLGFYQDMTIIFHHHPGMLCCTPFSFMEEAIFLDINNFERTCDVIQSSLKYRFCTMYRYVLIKIG